MDGMYGAITALAWTDDGQILTVATQSGTLLNYLAKIPNIVDSCGLRVAHLSSLRELSVSDTTGETPTLTLSVSVEPSFVALGPLHVAVRAMYYRGAACGQSYSNHYCYLMIKYFINFLLRYLCSVNI